LSRAFEEVGVGEKPTVFVPFSLGGIILKMIFLEHSQIAKNALGVLFVGTPHFGSDVVRDTKKKLSRIMPGIVPFFSMQSSISEKEFVKSFLKNISLSNTTLYLC